MAIAWCLATGIYPKMMEDVVYVTKSKIIPETRRSKIRSKIRTLEEALTTAHLMPPFIMIAIGLALSGIAFCAEKFRQRALRAEKELTFMEVVFQPSLIDESHKDLRSL